jgi:hypothetical protein
MSKIPQERKAMYYIGTGLIIVGVILFFSVFVSVGCMMSNPYGMSTGAPSFGNAIFGFILIAIGSVVKNIGARGVAGSGVILDPEQAREDLKPYSEAAGGMLGDVISNIDGVDKLIKPEEEKEVVKIRCRSCKALNDEDAKFCKNCGAEL